MPYKSDRQRRYFNANKSELEAQGVDVDHWNEESKGKDLPETATKEKKAMQRKEAITKMAAYVRYLGNKIPVGDKAASVEVNLRKASKLHKLAKAIEKHENLFDAVNECYADKSAAYRHQVIQGLVRGLSKKIAQAKEAMGMRSAMGVSKHPSASIAASTTPAGGSGIKTTGPMSTTSVLG